MQLNNIMIKKYFCIQNTNVENVFFDVTRISRTYRLFVIILIDFPSEAVRSSPKHVIKFQKSWINIKRKMY